MQERGENHLNRDSSLFVRSSKGIILDNNILKKRDLPILYW